MKILELSIMIHYQIIQSIYVQNFECLHNYTSTHIIELTNEINKKGQKEENTQYSFPPLLLSHNDRLFVGNKDRK